MRVYVIIPILYNKKFEEITIKEFEAAARRDTKITVSCLERGPASIESMYDESIATPCILEKVKCAEENGFDAVIIDCMGDPGLHAAREIVKIPVIGPAEASMALAHVVSHRFSVVTVLKSVLPIFDRMVRAYGFEARFASARSIDIPVLELEKEEETKRALTEESKKAIEEDKADTIILGCTGMAGMARGLQEALGVPVIDPTWASLKIAESLVDMKISHSKSVYPTPPDKIRKI
jgi:allantoin racemase